MGSIKEQRLLIQEMQNIDLIIYSGETDNWSFKPQNKLPLVNKYISSNFLNNIKILSWEIKLK